MKQMQQNAEVAKFGQNWSSQQITNLPLFLFTSAAVPTVAANAEQKNQKNKTKQRAKMRKVENNSPIGSCDMTSNICANHEKGTISITWQTCPTAASRTCGSGLVSSK